MSQPLTQWETRQTHDLPRHLPYWVSVPRRGPGSGKAMDNSASRELVTLTSERSTLFLRGVMELERRDGYGSNNWVEELLET
jgi:hypothetical protein